MVRSTRRRISSGLRSGTSVLASLAMVAGTLTVLAPVARAAEPGVDELVGMVGKLADWTSGLGAIDNLGEAVPLLTASPGGVLGYTGTGKKAVTVDPCVWLEMTNKDDADLTNNQHHHGTDWQYGGWGRDVMQGNVTQNGPNVGDRMIDWTGAYNLYTHCNAAYGGQNDIRLLAPDLHEFLTKLAWGDGAGQVAADVTTAGRSAYRELAFTYQEDFQEHGIGPAFPGTPGHFDQPNSCEE